MRTDVTGMICWPQNVIGELLSCVRRRAVAQRMNCVSEGLRLRRIGLHPARDLVQIMQETLVRKFRGMRSAEQVNLHSKLMSDDF